LIEKLLIQNDVHPSRVGHFYVVSKRLKFDLEIA